MDELIKFIKEYLLKPGAKGCYTPGFLMTDLSFDVDVTDLANLTQEALGTFTHEYIHYLQNVSTPFGLWQSMVIYTALSDLFQFVQTHKKPIPIPLKDYKPNDDISNRIAILKEINGENNFYNLKKGEGIVFSRHPVAFPNRTIERITLHVTSEGGEKLCITLGAFIIKESMAALMQELIDPNSKLLHKDVPYNIISQLADQHFRNISKDIRKLASICFISLFTLSPGIKSIDYLTWADDNPSKTIEEIFIHFTEDSIAKKSNGEKLTIEQLSDDIAEHVKRILGILLYGDKDARLDYISTVLDRVKVSEGLIPLLRLLTEQEVSPELIQMAVDTCGIPVICDSYGRVSLPTAVDSHFQVTDEGSKDVLILTAFWGMFSKLTDSQYMVCPLFKFCNGNSLAFKEECESETPWEGKECLMSIVAHRLGMI